MKGGWGGRRAELGGVGGSGGRRTGVRGKKKGGVKDAVVEVESGY